MSSNELKSISFLGSESALKKFAEENKLDNVGRSHDLIKGDLARAGCFVVEVGTATPGSVASPFAAVPRRRAAATSSASALFVSSFNWAKAA